MHLARFCHMPLNPPCLDLWQVAVCAEWSTFRQKCITQKCSSNTFCWVAIGSARAGLLRISLTIFFLPVLQHICIWMVWEDLIWCLSRGQASLEEVLLLLVAKLLTQPPAFLMLHMLAVFRISHVFQVFYHFEEGTQTLAGHEHDVLTPFSREFTRRFNHVQTANHIILMLCTKKARQMSIIVLVLFSTWNQGRISFVAHLCGLVLLSWHHAGEAPWIGRSDVIAIGRLHQRKVGNLL